jgi:ArsR family transcriptional regulator
VPDPKASEHCCDEAGDLAVAEGTVRRRARAFKALSNPTRLRILELVAHKQGIICESELVGGCCRGQPTISHHVKVLKDAGLLECERQGLWCHYFVRKDALRELAAVLSDMAC